MCYDKFLIRYYCKYCSECLLTGLFTSPYKNYPKNMLEIIGTKGMSTFNTHFCTSL